MFAGFIERRRFRAETVIRVASSPAVMPSAAAVAAGDKYFAKRRTMPIARETDGSERRPRVCAILKRIGRAIIAADPATAGTPAMTGCADPWDVLEKTSGSNEYVGK